MALAETVVISARASPADALAAPRPNGREPAGLATILQGMVAFLAREVPTTDGVVLGLRPDIAVVASRLPTYVQSREFRRRPGGWTCAPPRPPTRPRPG